jgi:hypothetical protein
MTTEGPGERNRLRVREELRPSEGPGSDSCAIERLLRQAESDRAQKRERDQPAARFARIAYENTTTRHGDLYVPRQMLEI